MRRRRTTTCEMSDKPKLLVDSTDILTRNRSGRFRIGERNMQHPGPAAGTRKGSAFLPAFALKLGLTATTPGIGSGSGGRGGGAKPAGVGRGIKLTTSPLHKARCDMR